MDNKKVIITCVDFVRFTWLNKHKPRVIDDSEEDELDYDDLKAIKPVEDGVRHYSNPTIWIGVPPDTITAATAFEVTEDIRAFLNEFNVTNVDIAYRETVPMYSAGPAVFAPVDSVDVFRGVIDPVSVALSLPIAGLGLRTTIQGPYFHVGKTLYAITARHNLFPDYADNYEYTFSGAFPSFTL